MELRTARQIAGLTQQQLAEKAGVDDSLISRLENGDRDGVRYTSIVRIARALNITNPLDLFPVEALHDATESPR